MERVSLKDFRPSPGVRGRGWLTVILWELTSSLVLRARWIVSSRMRKTALAMFGAKIGRGLVAKHPISIKYPWRLTIGDDCWIGEDVWIDNIEAVEIGSNVCLSQGAYLCTGNHDWSKRDFPLTARPIVIENGVWVGAKAIIGPGVRLKEQAVVTAGSVMNHDAEPNVIYQGNPAVRVKDRHIQ